MKFVLAYTARSGGSEVELLRQASGRRSCSRSGSPARPQPSTSGFSDVMATADLRCSRLTTRQTAEGPDHLVELPGVQRLPGR
jgi:hypothetical protein